MTPSHPQDSGMVVAFHIEVSGLAALLVSFKASMYNKYYQKGRPAQFCGVAGTTAFKDKFQGSLGYLKYQ